MGAQSSTQLVDDLLKRSPATNTYAFRILLKRVQSRARPLAALLTRSKCQSIARDPGYSYQSFPLGFLTAEGLSSSLARTEPFAEEDRG